AADRAGGRGDRERHPGRDRRGRALAADHAGGDARGALRLASEGPRGSATGGRMSSVSMRGLELVRLDSLDALPADGALPIAGGTEVVPLLRDGLVQADTLVDVLDLLPRGVDGTRIGAATTLSELEAADVPDALREAARLASSPQLRNMG